MHVDQLTISTPKDDWCFLSQFAGKVCPGLELSKSNPSVTLDLVGSELHTDDQDSLADALSQTISPNDYDRLMLHDGPSIRVGNARRITVVIPPKPSDVPLSFDRDVAARVWDRMTVDEAWFVLRTLYAPISDETAPSTCVATRSVTLQYPDYAVTFSRVGRAATGRGKPLPL